MAGKTKTQAQFDKDLKVAVDILKETYISNIVYVQERVKAGAKEDELKQIDELIIANERMIVYFDESDNWVKELHEEARKGMEKENGKSSTDDAAEVARIEEARNS
jgi:hypothetical protein